MLLPSRETKNFVKQDSTGGIKTTPYDYKSLVCRSVGLTERNPELPSSQLPAGWPTHAEFRASGRPGLAETFPFPG
jgi:hypothetical protein